MRYRGAGSETVFFTTLVCLIKYYPGSILYVVNDGLKTLVFSITVGEATPTKPARGARKGKK